MAKQKLLTTLVTVNAVSLADQITSAVLTYNYEDLDATAFGDAARRHEGGLTTGSLAITWKPNDDLTTTANAIFALLNTVVACTVQAENAAIAAGNPEMQFNCLISESLPFGGGVGSLYEPSTTWPLDTIVTMDVTP